MISSNNQLLVSLTLLYHLLISAPILISFHLLAWGLRCYFFPSLEVKGRVVDLWSPRVTQTVAATHTPLSTALAVSHYALEHRLHLPSSQCVFYFPCDFILWHIGYLEMWCLYSTFVNFPNFLIFFTVIILHDLNLFQYEAVLWPNTWPILKNVPCALKKQACLATHELKRKQSSVSLIPCFRHH